MQLSNLRPPPNRASHDLLLKKPLAPAIIRLKLKSIPLLLHFHRKFEVYGVGVSFTHVFLTFPYCETTCNPAGLVLDLPLSLRTPPHTVSQITCKEATGARNPRILCTRAIVEESPLGFADDHFIFAFHFILRFLKNSDWPRSIFVRARICGGHDCAALCFSMAALLGNAQCSENA